MVSQRVLPDAKGSQTISSVSDRTRSSLLYPQDSEKDWIVIPIRSPFLKIVVFFVSVAFVFLVGRKAVLELVAGRLADNPTIENLQKAIRLSPGNAEYHYLLGHALESTLVEANVKEALSEYEKATRLNPHNAFYWLQLAKSYEAEGRIEDAHRAVEQAARADPNQPLVAWQVGNFELRYGKIEEALRHFRVVLIGSRDDPTLAQAVFDLAWRGTGDNRLILDSAIPQETGVELRYLNFLLTKGRLDEGLQVWSRIARQEAAFRPDDAFPLFDALIAGRRVDEAKQVWNQLVQLLRLNNKQLDDRGGVVNGGFEEDILSGGFDWRFMQLEHVGLRFDPVVFRGGTRSLSITFDGKENVAYSHLFQLVPVQPDTLYLFRGWMKAEQVTTDSGPQFEVTDYFAPSPLLATGESVLGTSSWRETQLGFRTGPETRLLKIAVVRNASRKLDNRIQGQIWIDDLSLQVLQDVGQITTESRTGR